jgi:hypothetical protein
MGITEYENVNWIYMPEDRVEWRAHVNTVMNLQVPVKTGNFLTT